MQRNKGKKAVKIDLEKAYDKISWSFLKNILRAVGLQYKGEAHYQLPILSVIGC